MSLTAGYVELARDLRSPEPCNKISSTESWSAPWSAKGFQMGYQKSLCFDALAAATRDTTWCRQVRPKRNWLLWVSADGAAYTARGCAEPAMEPRPLATQTAYGGNIAVLRVLGCRDEDILALLHVDPEMRKFAEGAMVGLWMTAYGEMVKNGQLRGHLGDIPDFSGTTIRHHIADPSRCAHAAAGPRS